MNNKNKNLQNIILKPTTFWCHRTYQLRLNLTFSAQPTLRADSGLHHHKHRLKKE